MGIGGLWSGRVAGRLGNEGVGWVGGRVWVGWGDGGFWVEDTIGIILEPTVTFRVF